jgi:hypothetical protein
MLSFIGLPAAAASKISGIKSVSADFFKMMVHHGLCMYHPTVRQNHQHQVKGSSLFAVDIVHPRM